MSKSVFNYILNASIIVLLIIVGYFGFSLINNTLKSSGQKSSITDTTSTLTNQPNIAIQTDVQNGTNENGVAAKFTDYLRSKGVDVVEMGNFSGTTGENTVVIDRSGDIAKAKRIASLLGVNQKNVIQQVNSSLYLDVTVVIGSDFRQLNPYKETSNNK